MLQELSIQNYALIEQVNLRFDEGLTIITGETGAGKSVVVGALGLILGSRANTEVLSDPEKKCVIEGKFDISRYGLEELFEEEDLDHEPITSFRREINKKGRSRAFINDTPVRLEQLKRFGERLVDVHSQDQTLLLNDPTFQLEVVDAFAAHDERLEEYKQGLSEYRRVCRELNELEAQEARSKQDLDYYQFQLEELQNLELQEGEQETLESELQVLSNAVDIREALEKASSLLSLGEDSLLDRSSSISDALGKAADMDERLNELQQRFESASIELKDIAAELEGKAEGIEHDPGRLEQIRERLDNIYRLQQKHRLETVEGLLELQQELDEKVQAIGSMDEDIQKLRDQKAAWEEQLDQYAEGLRKGREAAIPGILEQVNALLPDLGMKNASVHIDLEPIDQYGERGKDNIVFRFSPGQGADAKPLNKVMSGGERSRVMLALKYTLSEKSALPTMVLDEIDTGVSGRVADKLGELMKRISERMQVISITHLPQVAGKGDRHFRAEKRTSNGATITSMVALDEQERIEELASMLSGEELTEAAYQNARSLLE